MSLTCQPNPPAPEPFASTAGTTATTAANQCLPETASEMASPPVPVATPDAGPALINQVRTSNSQTADFNPAGLFASRSPGRQRGPASTMSRDGSPQCELTAGAFLAKLQGLRHTGTIATDGQLRQIAAMVEAADKQGLLDRTDAAGISLLQRLDQIADTPVTPGLQGTVANVTATPGHVLMAVLKNVTDPESTEGIQQRESTCAAKTMEYLMATTDPAGYAGMIGQLAAGRDVAGKDGSTITLDRSALKSDSPIRNLASRLFQASVNHTMITNWRGKHVYTNDNPEMVKNRGMEEDEAAKAMKALMGPGWHTKNGKPDLATLRTPTVAAIRWHMDAEEVAKDRPSNGHAILIDHIDNGRVYFRDPGETNGNVGREIQANGQDFGPRRRVEGGSLYSMPADAFRKLVEYYSQPPAEGR